MTNVVYLSKVRDLLRHHEKCSVCDKKVYGHQESMIYRGARVHRKCASYQRRTL